MSIERADIVVVGAGAAGLFAAIWAARTNRGLRVVAVDGAKTLGAKILVAGGGRCNVTHHAVHTSDYSGSTPALIDRVLRRFQVEDTIEFFERQGVTLKREATGKLFPTTDRARSVLDALLAAAREVGVQLLHPMRIDSVKECDGGFLIEGASGSITTQRVILSTGGLSLPKSGSDGAGLRMAESLEHSATSLIHPALVPLTLAPDHWLTALSGLAVPAAISVARGDGKSVRERTGRPLQSIHGAVLCTHFGLSGPAILDVSRHWLQAKSSDAGAHLLINWLPGSTAQSLDQELTALKGTSLLGALRARLPERFLRAACGVAGVDGTCGIQQLTRDKRHTFTHLVCSNVVHPTGSRGFAAAETTAGGVPLSQLNLEQLESLHCRGLFMCGEMLDVDGRLGGFSFQWAWSSGFVAGTSAARSLT